MKKLKFLLRTASLCMAFILMGSISVSAKTPKVKKIKFSNVSSKKTLYRGTTKKFTVKITPSKAKSRKLQWYSSNKKVATVSSKGTVTAKKNGTAYITARVKSQKSKKVRCKVTVKTKKVSKVSFNTSKVVLQQGKYYTRKPSVSPSYAYNKKVTYKSSNTKVVTVNSSGKIYAKGQGTATITATSADGSKKKSSYPVRVIGKITSNPSSGTKFVAHRGLSSQAPENTVKAFELAGDAGFWGAETDIRKTSDGAFVAMHDATFKRMCGENKRPEDMTADEIRKLKIISGSNYTKYKNDSDANKVAFLEDYLKVCKEKDMVPVIEIKMEYAPDGNVTRNNMQDIVQSDMKELNKQVQDIMGEKDYIFIAFDLETMVQMNKVIHAETLPNVSIQHVVNYANTGNINYYKNRGFALDCDYTSTSGATIDRFMKAGIPVNVWVVDDEEKVWDFINKKVDYITTNKKFWS
ncbi:glycerophosphodiester phosphodiesterase family protein [Anaerostipes sp.]|uniref:glycerophosphodiester phosphodiesterase family protein n=1 Tax=Anaerostipes sp. TaxID=1872530 RepID=UPI0025C103FB|nr:glycerophosphodiester phosphodiesterase family protein [Anaerostipes sp.]